MAFDDLDDVEQLIVMPPDFPHDDLSEIASKLAKNDVFIPGYIPAPGSLYDPNTYLSEAVSGTTTVLLTDRNVVSPIVRLAKGANTDAQGPIAAGILAFAQCVDFLIEPSISFHELYTAQGNEVVREELALFRAADNTHPQLWLDYALGRKAQPNAIPMGPAPDIDLSLPLKRWRRNYILALKIADLSRESGTHLNKMLRLFDWMEKEVIFGGPAALMAALEYSH